VADHLPWRPKTGEIPTNPGVYRFRDERGRILYVGKAKNLRNRLANYFQPLSRLHERTRHMVLTARSVEWTVVNSDFEALQLEWTWIKEFDPPYNVQYRDDKSYPYLAITLGDPVPRVFVTRTKGIRNARYFGPYSRAWAIRDTVDTMLRAFPMRSCTDGVYQRAQRSGRPCLLGDIGKCAAPCVGRISLAEHKAIAVDFAAFIEGGDQGFIADTRRRMTEASEAQDYEQAATLRDRLQAMQWALERNAVVLGDDVDADFFGIADDELAAAVQQFTVRGGRIRGVRAWNVDKELDIGLPELVETVLETAYADETVPPRQIYVPAMPADPASIEQWLSERRQSSTSKGAAAPGGGTRGARVSLAVPRRGEKAQLAATVAENARQALVLYKTRRSADFVARSNALNDLAEALGMADAPLRIECYDVSHLQGTNVVASMVVFEDGLPRKDQYRKFSIAETRDDTDSIHQVLARRLARIEEETEAGVDEDGRRKRFAYRPQLLLIDGGQPQVAAAQRAVEEAGAPAVGIRVVGIAKRLEELWLPGEDDPVILPRSSDALFLVQRLRDEAHRFAIGYQRQRRKRDLRSVLEEIPGVGPARVKEILRHFGSVARVRAASEAELAEVRGVGEATAQVIHERLRSGSADPVR